MEWNHFSWKKATSSSCLVPSGLTHNSSSVLWRALQKCLAKGQAWGTEEEGVSSRQPVAAFAHPLGTEMLPEAQPRGAAGRGGAPGRGLGQGRSRRSRFPRHRDAAAGPGDTARWRRRPARSAARRAGVASPGRGRRRAGGKR